MLPARKEFEMETFEQAVRAMQSPKRLEARLKNIPMGRAGTAKDMTVDGGRLLA